MGKLWYVRMVFLLKGVGGIVGSNNFNNFCWKLFFFVKWMSLMVDYVLIN